MKNKNLILITIFSVLACGIHSVMLNTQFSNYTYTSVLKVILFTLCPLIYFAVSKDGNFSGMFTKGDKKNIRLAFVLGFIVFAFIALVFAILRPFLNQEMIAGAFAKNGITGSNFPLVFIYVVLINAALEEIFFRGFVFMTFYRMNCKKYAHTYSCLLFAFYHTAILNGAISVGIFIFCIVGLAAAGLIFNVLALKCKSISGSLIVHISANLAINLMIALCYF